MFHDILIPVIRCMRHRFVLRISKVYACRMKMEIRVSICMPIHETLRWLSYKESVSTARLEILFLSFVIELLRSGYARIVRFYSCIKRNVTIMQTRSQRVNLKLLHAVLFAKLPRNHLLAFTIRKLYREVLRQGLIWVSCCLFDPLLSKFF